MRRAGVVHGENEPHGVAPAFCTERINHTETRVALLVTDEAGIFATAEGGFLFYFGDQTGSLIQPC